MMQPNIRPYGWFDGVHPELTEGLTTSCGCATPEQGREPGLDLTLMLEFPAAPHH